MKDFKMLRQVLPNDPTGIDLSNGLRFTKDAEGVEQRLIIKLKTMFGEYFYDTSRGIQYQDRVFVKNPNMVEIENIFRAQILSTPGIMGVPFIRAAFNNSTRHLTITFKADVNSDLGVVTTLDMELQFGA